MKTKTKLPRGRVGKPSPAPWQKHLHCDSEPDRGFDVRDARGRPVTGWGCVLQTKGNANLIAAAPCLYRELRHLVRLLEPVEDTLNVPGLATLNGARAAIAKAEGK